MMSHLLRNKCYLSHLTFNLSPFPYTSISYFSQRYFTTCGGRILVLGVMWLARRKAASVRSQRRKVSPLTPPLFVDCALLGVFRNGSHRLMSTNPVEALKGEVERMYNHLCVLQQIL